MSDQTSRPMCEQVCTPMCEQTSRAICVSAVGVAGDFRGNRLARPVGRGAALIEAADGPRKGRALCSMVLGERIYGVDITQVCEILGPTQTWRVPLAPHFVGGLIPYRGEVLATVHLRALFGMERMRRLSCVLVVEGSSGRYGLLVDEVLKVVEVDEEDFEPIPSTLDEGRRRLLCAAYKLSKGLLIELDPQRLDPMRLAAMLADGADATGNDMGSGDGSA